MATRVLVMYLGRVAEIGPTQAIYAGSRHPYTSALMGSILSMDPNIVGGGHAAACHAASPGSGHSRSPGRAA